MCMQKLFSEISELKSCNVFEIFSLNNPFQTSLACKMNGMTQQLKKLLNILRILESVPFKYS